MEVTFTVYFGERTTHSVKVVLHRTKVGVCRSSRQVSESRTAEHEGHLWRILIRNHDAIRGPIGELHSCQSQRPELGRHCARVCPRGLSPG